MTTLEMLNSILRLTEEDKLFSTYFNKYSFYNSGKVIDEVENILSLGEKGVVAPREFPVKRTELVDKPKSLDKAHTRYHVARIYNKCPEMMFELNERRIKIEDMYSEFKIRKQSGGHRTILAPSSDLKELQRTIVNFFKNHLEIKEHNAAHAYVENRSNRSNASVHVNNYNFINVDLSDFFPSIKESNILEALVRTANARDFIIKNPDFIEKIIPIVLYNGGLPQGAVSSPYLSNLVMTSFDYHMEKYLKENRRDIVYTRYADDMTFSSKLKINTQDILEIIEIVKKQAYLDSSFIKINPKKTRHSTYRGKNRVTGVKINANNELSIGYKEKQDIKSDMFSMLVDKTNGIILERDRVEATVGMFSYLQSVEPGYAKHLLRKWSRKFNINNIVSYLLKY